MTRSASSVYAEYAFEDSFGGGATTSTPIQFGKEVKITGLEFKNNQQPLGDLYSPEIQTFAYGKNEGKCSAEFVLSNPWFFESILDSATSALDSGTLYTHTWSSSGTTSKTINSMALKFGFDVSTDYLRLPVGAVCPSLSIKMALNETVKITQELIWGEETVNQTFSEPDGTALAGEIPYTFVHAQITSPLTGSTLATVQTFDLNINSNAELVYGFNSANSEDVYRKILEITGKIGVTLKSSAFLEDVFGRAESSNDLTVTLSNGASGNALREIVMTFSGCSFSTHNTTGIEPGELVIENIDFQCRTASVVAKNELSDVPDSV